MSPAGTVPYERIVVAQVGKAIIVVLVNELVNRGAVEKWLGF